MIDSHAHMDMEHFDKDRSRVIERAREGGLSHIIAVGIDLDSSFAALNLAKHYGMIYSSVGYHPHSAEQCSWEALERLVSAASENKVVAWGEIGLDYFRYYSSPEAQVESFQVQMGIARDLGMPVIIHDREAHEEVFRIVKEMGKGDRKGVIHCFSGDLELAEAFIKLGYYISIPGTVTYKKASSIKDVAKGIPLERMLIETDAPFLAPVPKRGKRNEPSFVRYTAMEIARLRNMNVDELDSITSRNVIELFNIPGD